MRDSINDLRVIRTKESIRDALVELINEKGFEALTVKDITTKAKINRGTFYAHFQDKFDLITKLEEEILNGMVEIAKQNIPDIITEFKTNAPTITPFTHAVTIFEYLNDNRGFLKALLGPKGGLSFQTKLKNIMWKIMFEDKETSLIKEENLLVPGQYLASFISSAFIGVVQQWLNNGSKETPQEMARTLSTITINGPYFAAGLKK